MNIPAAKSRMLLNKYFREHSKEEIEESWKSTEYFDSVGPTAHEFSKQLDRRLSELSITNENGEMEFNGIKIHEIYNEFENEKEFPTLYVFDLPENYYLNLTGRYFGFEKHSVYSTTLEKAKRKISKILNGKLYFPFDCENLKREYNNHLEIIKNKEPFYEPDYFNEDE